MPKRTINPTFIPRDGLVGERLLDGNGNDTSGNGNDGTVSGVTWVSADRGYVEEVGSFDGVNDSVDLGAYDIGRTFTFSCRFSVDAFVGEIARFREGGINFKVDGSNENTVMASIYDGTAWQDVSITVTAGEYIFLTVTSVESSNTLSIYKNSVLEDTLGSITYTGGETIGSMIGSYPTGIDNNRDGKIGLVRHYNRELSQNEIDTLYLEGLRKLGKQTALTSNGFPYYSLPNLEDGKVLEISKAANGGTYYDQS